MVFRAKVLSAQKGGPLAIKETLPTSSTPSGLGWSERGELLLQAA